MRIRYIIVWCALVVMTIGAAFVAQQRDQARAENAALKADLAQAQARLDEFYEANVTVSVGEVALRAVPPLNKLEVGYLVLRYGEGRAEGMCQAHLQDRRDGRSLLVGNEFICPSFPGR